MGHGERPPVPFRDWEQEKNMYKAQLRTFLCVCDTGSFSQAAQRLFITPSAVVQQINTLEKDLGVQLFNRQPSGVTLTMAGEYLKVEGLAFIRKSEDIRKELLSIVSQNHQICIGTSLIEKSRLLYSLWMLFSEQEPQYEIKMVNLVMGQVIPARTDLIESVNSGVAWMKEWDFFKICEVPFGFAVPTEHALARKEIISMEDLKGKTVISLNRGSSPQIVEMLNSLESHQAYIQYPERVSSSSLWESSFRNRIILLPVCWEDIVLNMKIVRCDWEYTIPYGIFYRRDLRPDAAHFLSFIKKVYTDGDPEGIVPVL